MERVGGERLPVEELDEGGRRLLGEQDRDRPLGGRHDLGGALAAPRPLATAWGSSPASERDAAAARPAPGWRPQITSIQPEVTSAARRRPRLLATAIRPSDQPRRAVSPCLRAVSAGSARRCSRSRARAGRHPRQLGIAEPGGIDGRMAGVGAGAPAAAARGARGAPGPGPRARRSRGRRGWRRWCGAGPCGRTRAPAPGPSARAARSCRAAACPCSPGRGGPPARRSRSPRRGRWRAACSRRETISGSATGPSGNIRGSVHRPPRKHSIQAGFRMACSLHPSGTALGAGAGGEN